MKKVTNWNNNLSAGSDWEAEIVIVHTTGFARDLTGMTLSSKIKRHHKSISAKENISIEIIDAVAGRVKLSLSNTQTSNLKSGKWQYDIESTITETGYVERLVEGYFLITPEIT